MRKIAELILELRLATRRACMCETGDNAKKSTLTLKTKVLYLIAREFSGREILSALGIAKTNLAILTGEMVREGLITKTHGSLDRREVSYSVTDAGREYLAERLDSIAENVAPVLSADEETEELLRRAVLLLGGDA